MCTGMHHCGACEDRAADEDVHDYIEGHTHVIPKINDGALVWATQLRREAFFSQLMVQQDRRAVSFPEFRNARNGGVYRDTVITSMRANFDRLLKALPAFATMAGLHPQPSGQHGGANRKRRIKTKQLWKRQIILRFAETPNGLDQMLQAVGWNKPWWLRATEDQSESLAKAA